ncbi:MAG: hypothetical protein KDJ29_00555, partial [Hyphomicrobiales bacterium]|nr:hypothetical protein [Hyphomicrobiales bacterium]
MAGFTAGVKMRSQSGTLNLEMQLSLKVKWRKTQARVLSAVRRSSIARIVSGVRNQPLVVISAVAAVLLVLTAVSPVRAAERDTEIQFDGNSGLFRVLHRGYPIVKSSLVFWKDNWRWAGVRVRSGLVRPADFEFDATSASNGLHVTGQANLEDSHKLRWRFDLKPGADSTIFGGFAFRLDQLPAIAGQSIYDSEIAADGRGWTLTPAPGAEPLMITFDPKPASVGFERNRKDEVRVYWAEKGQAMKPGTYTMAIDLPPEVGVRTSPLQRLQNANASWYEDAVSIAQFPVDLSYLNDGEKPAGKRGFLGSNGGRLAFADGTRPRFWGTNLTAYAVLRTGRDDVVRQARRLSRLGFNLVRLHHLDSDWVKSNIIAGDGPGRLVLNEDALERVDWWIKALADEGIYTWLDLEVGRVFASDGIPAAEEMSNNGKGIKAKGFAYLSPAIEDRMKAFNSLLLNHVNRFTGLAYKDDPRIAFFLVTNENDLTHHFGNLFLPDKNRPTLSADYMSRAKAFAARHNLDSKKIWRAWEFGPSKLFLNDLEHQFNQRMIDDLHTLGVKVPVATTNSFGAPASVAGVPSQSDGGIVAANIYSESGEFAGDPQFAPNLMASVAGMAENSRPFAVTEWNTGRFPNVERSALPVYVASVAALQDWDAMMVYAYSQFDLRRQGLASTWEVGRDPA